jgi:anti-sigma factor RsiW
MNFGLMYQPTEGEGGPRIPWGWLFGAISAVLGTVIVAGFRLVWRGAMADFELRLQALEREQLRARDREAHRLYAERARHPKMEITP